MSGQSIGINAHLLSFTPGYRRAGVSQYTEQVLRHFIVSGLDPGDSLTMFVGHGDLQRMWVSERNTLRYSHSLLPTGQAPGRILWEQLFAPFAMSRTRLDVLFCPVNVVPMATPISTVVTVHDLAFVVHPEAFHTAKRRYLTLMTRLSVHRARHVIAVSTHTRDDLVRHFDVRTERITVIPNAADVRFRPTDDAQAIAQFRAVNNLPDRFVLFVGTLEPRKNLRRLIEAFASLAHDDVETKLVIVGASGWLTSDLASLVRERGLSDRIIFTGYVSDDDLPHWYQAATVFCYPSLYEGFGLPVLEAMACGTPVVTSRTSSLPELVGGAAALVDPTDVAELSNALRMVLDDASRRHTMSQAGLARARAFSWERTAAATLDVIRTAARH